MASLNVDWVQSNIKHLKYLDIVSINIILMVIGIWRGRKKIFHVVISVLDCILSYDSNQSLCYNWTVKTWNSYIH